MPCLLRAGYVVQQIKQVPVAYGCLRLVLRLSHPDPPVGRPGLSLSSTRRCQFSAGQVKAAPCEQGRGSPRAGGSQTGGFWWVLALVEEPLPRQPLPGAPTPPWPAAGGRCPPQVSPSPPALPLAFPLFSCPPHPPRSPTFPTARFVCFA